MGHYIYIGLQLLFFVAVKGFLNTFEVTVWLKTKKQKKKKKKNYDSWHSVN